MPRRHTIAHTTRSNKHDTINLLSTPTQPNPHHHQSVIVRHCAASSIIVRFRPSSSRVGRHGASPSQANQTRIRKSVPHKSCQTHTTFQSMHTTTVSFSHARCFHDACICLSVPRHNTIAHPTQTTNTKKSTYPLHPRNQMHIHHQEHAKTPPVRHRSVSFIIIPRRPSSCKLEPRILKGSKKISPTQAVSNAHIILFVNVTSQHHCTRRHIQQTRDNQRTTCTQEIKSTPPRARQNHQSVVVRHWSWSSTRVPFRA